MKRYLVMMALCAVALLTSCVKGESLNDDDYVGGRDGAANSQARDYMMAIADDLVADGRLIGGDEVRGEAVREGGEGVVEPKPGDLPVAGGGVLAGADLHAAARAAHGLRIRGIVRALHLSQADPGQVRQVGVHGIHHMAEGVRAHIAVGGGVRQLAAADRVQHGEKDSSHGSATS